MIDNRVNLEIHIQGSRVDNFSHEILKKMKMAGVKSIFFGIESGVQEILDYYKKKITLDQIREAINAANKMGIFTIGSFIFGAPFETRNYIEKTIKFACSLPLDITLWRHLSYKYGSDLFNEAVENGHINLNDYSILADSELGLGILKKEEIEYYCDKAFREFYFRPNYIIKKIFKLIRQKEINYIKAITKLLIKPY